MNKKLGFTLVELMAVLVVLGLILLMSVPSITSTLQKSKEQKAQEQENALCTAARSYFELEKDDAGKVLKVPQKIKITDLINKEYVKEENVEDINKEKSACLKIVSSKMQCSIINNSDSCS